MQVRIAPRCPKGTTVPVHWMPDNPEECLLEPGVKGQFWFLTAFGLIFLTVVILMAALLPKALRNQALAESVAEGDAATRRPLDSHLPVAHLVIALSTHPYIIHYVCERIKTSAIILRKRYEWNLYSLAHSRTDAWSLVCERRPAIDIDPNRLPHDTWGACVRYFYAIVPIRYINRHVLMLLASGARVGDERGTPEESQ